MKYLHFLLFVFFFHQTNPADAAQLNVHWKFLHVQNGYDHLNKIEVYIDDALLATSESYHESELGTLKIDVPKGLHKITIKDFAYYEGVWEEHATSKGYSVDANFEGSKKLKSKNHLTLLWDIDKNGKEALIYAWKKPNAKLLNETKVDKTGSQLVASWKFIGVKEGFDHNVRMVVYVDGKNIFTSPIGKMTNANMFKTNIPKDFKEIKLVVEAFYEGTWEEHVVKNAYSLDAIVVKNEGLTSKMNVEVEFNLVSNSVKAIWK